MIGRGGLIVAVVALAAGDAVAIERDCPSRQTWSPNLGACVARQASPAASAAARYYQATAALEAGQPGDAARARRVLAETCKARHPASCTLLGFLHERGRGGAVDAATAVTHYQRGCDLGDADGCLAASTVWAYGLTGEPAPSRAVPPLARACELGSGRGCYALAAKYDGALGVAHDDATAQQLYTRAVGRLVTECPGSGPSCYVLGLAYRDGHGTGRDQDAAAKAFGAGCDGGGGAACFALGELYRDGDLGPAQRDRALDYFDRSCQRYDNADGCHAAGGILSERADPDPARLTALGDRACALATARCDLAAYLFATGKGGVRDEGRATDGYLTACQAGNSTACSAAATRIAHGTGTRADGALAVRIWERACATGSGSDCYQAAIAHRDGELVTADAARALDLLAVGCVRGSAPACEDAGLAHLDGLGAADDLARAQALLTAGCRLGRGETCTILGDALRDGDPLPIDATAAQALYQQGCIAATPDSAACAAWANLADEPATALDAATRACRLGDAASCSGLDDRARTARADEAARHRTLDAITAGCAASPPSDAACATLYALHAEGGYLTPAQPTRGHALVVDACARGSGSACLAVADDLATGTGVVPDLAAARARYAAMCDRGVEAACWSLGIQLFDDDRAIDAAGLFRRSCDAGLGVACTSLGFAHYVGRGAPWDIEAAHKSYLRGCELGDDVACVNLGELAEHGIGGPPDPAAAVTRYQAACTDASVAGCTRLAAAVERGAGGEPADRGRALRLADRACTAGSAEACAIAARLIRDDAPRAARLAQWAIDLARAEAETNPYAAYLVGRFHADGVGTARDHAAARTWFDRACEGRDPIGCMAAGELHAGDGERALAVASYDRACGAAIDRACAAAAAARRGLPMAGRGCACDTGRDPGALVWAGLVVATLLRRRRRAAAPR